MALPSPEPGGGGTGGGWAVAFIRRLPAAALSCDGSCCCDLGTFSGVGRTCGMYVTLRVGLRCLKSC